MNYLLDTNVISETYKKSPSPVVTSWFNSIDSKKFSLSVLTLGEIRKGVEMQKDPLKKQRIVQWLEVDLVREFSGRIICINEEIVNKWGYIAAVRDLPVIDALIAATALVHNFKLVTRNTKDFKGIIGLEVFNPWDEN